MAHSNWGRTPINSRNYQAIGRRYTSVELWNQVGNPNWRDVLPGTVDEIDSADPRASIWLYSSNKWNKPFPKGWEAIQVLGCGGFGICGHWRYITQGPHPRGPVQGEIHDIVVKQSSAMHGNGMVNEARLMEMLTKTGSRHFPQIYGRLHRDVGRQDRVLVDQKRREVHRIFMEYFEGGSVGKHIRNTSYYNIPTPEAELWAWFHCFAKAAVLMERGHETEAASRFSHAEPWGQGREVVHFDLKPDNALIATHDRGEHVNHKRVVISDFGLSERLPNERNGPHRRHDEILLENEDVGTVTFRAPEQLKRIDHPLRRYGACTNIYQIGCIMYCLIMQAEDFTPYHDRPSYTRLTNTWHRTAGGEDLEAMNDISRVLRGLVAECLFLDPAHRPTTMELLKLTRAGLQRLDPAGAMASKLNEKLNPVRTLLLDRWFGKDPSALWPQRIPEMQDVVNMRKRQLQQAFSAKAYVPGQRAGQNPPAAGKKGPGPPAGPAAGQNPREGGVRPGAAPNGAGRAAPPVAKPDDPLVRRKPWPGEKFASPVRVIRLPADLPRKPKARPGDATLAKQPDWDKVVKHIKPNPAGLVPRPRKRPSKEPPAAVPHPKRSRGKGPPPARQVNTINHWLHAVDLNRVNPPQPRPEQIFLMPVRVWPGPTPSPADEAIASLRSFRVPISATIADLLKIMTDDEAGSIKHAVRCTFAKPGSAWELPPTTKLAELGYGPSPRVRSAHLECFRIMFVPQRYGLGGVAKTFTVVVSLRPGDQVANALPSLTLKAGYQMSILQLKQVIIDSKMHPNFKVKTQLKLNCGTTDEAAWDCPDHRLIKSFFRAENETARLWCSLRPIGGGGSGRNRKALPFSPVYTPPPPRHRINKRFL
ncbi:hypothetical protein ACLOAV_008880 [Pseudogymnoascus australis]